jgi:hypothetical protein
MCGNPAVGMMVDLAALDASTVKGYVDTAQIRERRTVPARHHSRPRFSPPLSTAMCWRSCSSSRSCSRFALVLAGDRGKPILDLIERLSAIIFRMVGLIMWVAPLGAFGAIAFTVGRFGGRLSRRRSARCLVEFYIVCLLFVFIVLGGVAPRVRRQPVPAALLHSRRDPDRRGDNVVRDRVAPARAKARSARLRGIGGRARGTDRLFVQSRRHLPLSRDPRSCFSHKQPTRRSI